MSPIGRRPALALCLFVFLDVFPAFAQMDLGTAAGQLFIFGLPWNAGANGLLSKASISHFKELKAGAFILFRRDLKSTEQIKGLTESLQQISNEGSKSPALIAVDQEGGVVTRIPFDPPLPSASALGRSGNKVLAKALGFETAVFLRQLGINSNLAPVLDLGGAGPSFIGSRSYSDQAEVVSDVGNAFALGLAEGKVLPVAKHFPGIGPVMNDPHVSLVRRSTPATELLAKDFIPFRRFAAIYPSGLMISHLIYPGLDPTGLPGTFSPAIQQKYAREIVGYSGLLMTDDLLMLKTRKMSEFQKNVQSAFIAGADLIMVSWSLDRQKAAIEAILDGVRKKLFTQEDVLARAERIIKMRKDIGKPEFSAPLHTHRIRLAESKKYNELINELSQTLFKEQVLTLAEKSPAQWVLIGAPRELLTAIQRSPLKSHFKVGSAAKGCALKSMCLVFSRFRRERIQLLSQISRLPASQRGRYLLVDFVDDQRPNTQAEVIHVPVKAPNWPTHFIEEFSALRERRTTAQNIQ